MAKETKSKTNYIVQPGKEKCTTWGSKTKLAPEGKYPALGECSQKQLAEIHENKLSKYITKLG